jgi:endonuclease YncB( thermonuclease family)
MYDYKAKVIRWHDGDTALVLVDQGFGVGITVWVRLMDCWAKEMPTLEGVSALAAARALVPDGTACYVITRKLDDKPWFQGKQLPQTFARWLGVIYPLDPQGGSVNEVLVATGHATLTREA